MGGVLVLRWLWERVNLAAEVASIAVSVVVAPVLLWRFGTDPADEWLRLGVMAAASTGAAVLATLLGPANPSGVLDRFYARVRPPGFWGRTAARAGEAPGAPVRLLGRRMAGVGVTAASLFLLLVGLGRMALGDGGGWLAVAGLVLVPVWVREVRREDFVSHSQ
jgi:hypothetical protein